MHSDTKLSRHTNMVYLLQYEHRLCQPSQPEDRRLDFVRSRRAYRRLKPVSDAVKAAPPTLVLGTALWGLVLASGAQTSEKERTPESNASTT